MQFCAGRAPSFQHTRVGGGRQGASPKATTMGVKSSEGRSQVFLHVLHEQSRRMGGGTHKEKNPLFLE